jgi:hypothetical protein
VNQFLSTVAIHDHINHVLIPTYKLRYKELMNSIKQRLLPLGAKITAGALYIGTTLETGVLSAGGFVTYIAFPAELPSTDVIAKRVGEKCNLLFAFGEMFIVNGDEGRMKRAAGVWKRSRALLGIGRG